MRGGLCAVALASLALAGCGASARNAALSQSQLRADYRGAPAPLAALFARQNKLLGGGAPAFERELRSLRGYPVVVNTWASWCEDCRQEFAIFQRVAPAYARTVAFVGDDFNDGGGAKWLSRFPLSFPSYDDRREASTRRSGRRRRATRPSPTSKPPRQGGLLPLRALPVGGLAPARHPPLYRCLSFASTR